MEDIIYAVHRGADGRDIAHVADVEADLFSQLRVLRLELMAHIILLFLIARENADLADVGCEKTVQHGIAEAARAAGDH